jgi:hypothetical protein
MAMNAEGKKPTDLLVHVQQKIVEKKPDYENVVGQDDLTRFDKKKNSKPKIPAPENTVNNPLMDTYATVPANIMAINKIKYNNTFFILIKYLLFV